MARLYIASPASRRAMARLYIASPASRAPPYLPEPLHPEVA
ncbi:MAG: hypothetical protein RIM23_04270 [Coleofasciculus sp. G3-WIS-01]